MASISLSLYAVYYFDSFTMPRCQDCGRHVRVPIPGRSPRCLAYGLACLPDIIQMRPCLVCRTPIPADSPHLHCLHCVQASQRIYNQDVRPCHDCGSLIPSRPGIICCFVCRNRGGTVVQMPTISSSSIPASYNPFVNSFQTSPRSKRRVDNSEILPASRRQRTTGIQDVEYIINQAIGFLQKEHESRVHASGIFPPEISPAHIRSSIAYYQNEISAAAQRSICASCGGTVPIANIRPVNHGDPLLLPLENYLDNCGKSDDVWNVCLRCHAALLRGSIPKFSAKNQVNVTLCQNYPDALTDLTLTEECLIAKCHPIGVVLKLRSGGRSSPVHYQALRGHFILIPQEPGPLLQILPSPALEFNQLIKVFWLGNRPLTESDLKPFLTVRKDKVLRALQYLVENNPLYQDVVINYPMVDEWADDFIPAELQHHIISVNNTDHDERQGYTVDLQDGNYENDWQAAEHDASDQSAPLLTASVAIDINGERQNPDVRVLNAVYNLVNGRQSTTEQSGSTSGILPDQGPEVSNTNIPVLQYTIHGQAALLNHWHDSHYFTAAFPTLFPMGVGGHLDQRDIHVSLAAFAKWALTHHSQR
jgi:hypothetical protein